MFQNRFDEFYLTICKEVGGIEGLLKSFFDFMFRKTDFFYECDPGDKMGFPPGYSRKLVSIQINVVGWDILKVSRRTL